MKTITWNEDKLKALKAAIDKAMSAGKLTTDAVKVDLPGEKEPAEFTVGYARHLVTYLDEQFAIRAPDLGPNLEGEEGQ